MKCWPLYEVHMNYSTNLRKRRAAGKNFEDLWYSRNENPTIILFFYILINLCLILCFLFMSYTTFFGNLCLILIFFLTFSCLILMVFWSFMSYTYHAPRPSLKSIQIVIDNPRWNTIKRCYSSGQVLVISMISPNKYAYTVHCFLVSY